MAGLSVERTTFSYDDLGNPVEQTTEDDRREIGINATGEMQTASQDSRKDQARFEYSYDAHGNWTERVVWARYGSNADFRRSNVERRLITYHEV